jgi:dTDP-glucose pyrophosphorylase
LRIIITFSGHSRRFKAAGYYLPKFLLNLGNQPIINHVINMFDKKSYFDLIFNKNQILEYPEIKKIISHILPMNNYRINEIEPHELGPAHSISLLKNIKDNEKILISYCDFIVQWNYRHFVNSLGDCDGAIPAFKGFHPASFGKTFYAYMKLNSKNELIELREKESFTSERYEEPASTGIYYFKKWSDFKFFYRKSKEDGIFQKNKKEHYVSLIFNKLVENNLKIKVIFVKKFICLGTPEDLDQYLNWDKYFKTKKLKILKFKNLINLIPMAGDGKRFKDYGYNISKPLIQIDNMPMVMKSCKSFPIPESWIFILKENDSKKFSINKKLSLNFENLKTIAVQNTTTGQAATCLYAKKLVPRNKSIYIASADYELFFDHEKFLKEIYNNKEIDVVIFTKRLKGNLIKNPNAFGYCLINNKNQILKIVEKKTISSSPGNDPLIVGSFWFRSSKLFFNLMDKIILNDIKVNNEHYIANGINLLIKQNYNVVSFNVDQWISFGDPFELELYYYWKSYFYDQK